MYGLKQGPRAWFGKFNQAIEAFGMQKSKSDHSVFYKNSNSGIILLGVTPKVYYLLNPFFIVNFTKKI